MQVTIGVKGLHIALRAFCLVFILCLFLWGGGGYFLCFCLAVHETVLDLKLSVMLFSVFSLIWFLYSNFSEKVYKVNRDWKILNDEGSISLSLFRIRILSGWQAII